MPYPKKQPSVLMFPIVVAAIMLNALPAACVEVLVRVQHALFDIGEHPVGGLLVE